METAKKPLVFSDLVVCNYIIIGSVLVISNNVPTMASRHFLAVSYCSSFVDRPRHTSSQRNDSLPTFIDLISCFINRFYC